MKQAVRRTSALVAAVLFGLVVCLAPQSALAVTNPGTGSVGLEGVIQSKPPATGATITSPSSGRVFTSIPITVSGLCPTGTLVKIFANNVFVGSVMCTNGSFSIQVDLFNGENDLVARVYDALDQPGPDSNIVRVTFDAGQYNPSDVQLISLSSNYARRGANPGSTLTWPLNLSGGTAPYAVSIDWGDGTSPDLISLSGPGGFTGSHVYANAGTYNILVKATDKNGVSAFLQLIGVANGAITSSASNAGNNNTPATIVKIMWLPAALMVPLIVAGFWLGRKYELSMLKKHLEHL